ncbi:hypothetical protein ACQUEU_01420 [Enterococcus casseliflavus]|uniref:hypothetical protein n=1 Tax=Enterococcus casseliflavus TaxID=37734 RepID=UPI003D0B643A
MNFFFSDTYQIILNSITAIGTLGSVIFALYFSAKELRERKVLLLKDQASKIYASSKSGKEGLIVKVHNESKLPIHSVFVITVLNQSGPSLEKQLKTRNDIRFLELCYPSETKTLMQDRGHSMGGKHEAVVIFFTDARGIEWSLDNRFKLRKSKNYVEKIIKSKLKFYPPY